MELDRYERQKRLRWQYKQACDIWHLITGKEMIGNWQAIINLDVFMVYHKIKDPNEALLLYTMKILKDCEKEIRDDS
jgi:hypothetical protein